MAACNRGGQHLVRQTEHIASWFIHGDFLVSMAYSLIGFKV